MANIISPMMLLQTNLLPPKRNNLEAYSWEEISRIRKAGKASEYFKIGDCKLFTLSNGTQECQFNAGILDISNDCIVFATFPEKKAFFTAAIHDSSKSSSVLDYKNTDFYHKFNTNNGIHIADNSISLINYCLSVKIPYLTYNLENGTTILNDGSDIEGPLYLPSFTDYGIDVDYVDFVGRPYSEYSQSPFIAKNYDFNWAYNLLENAGESIYYTCNCFNAGYTSFKKKYYRYVSVMSTRSSNNRTISFKNWSGMDASSKGIIQPFFYI